MSGDTEAGENIDSAPNAAGDLGSPLPEVALPQLGPEYRPGKNTGPPSGADEDAGPALAEVPFPEKGALYDPTKERETTRSSLALRVVWLLVGVIGLLMGAVISGLRTWEQLEGMSTSVLPAVLAVVGTVLGFYFGSQKGQ